MSIFCKSCEGIHWNSVIPKWLWPWRGPEFGGLRWPWQEHEPWFEKHLDKCCDDMKKQIDAEVIKHFMERK